MKRYPSDDDYKEPKPSRSFETGRQDSGLVCTPKRLCWPDLVSGLARLAKAACPVLRESWHLFTVWLLIPLAGAGCYLLLKKFGFPFPGLGIFVGSVLTANALRGEASPVFHPTGIGFLLYCFVVVLGHRNAIFTDQVFENFLDASLIGKAQALTKYHWLGLACFGLSHLIIDPCPCHSVRDGSHSKAQAQGHGWKTFVASLLPLVGASFSVLLTLGRPLLDSVLTVRRRHKGRTGVGRITIKEEQLTIVLDDADAVPQRNPPRPPKP